MRIGVGNENGNENEIDGRWVFGCLGFTVLILLMVGMPLGGGGADGEALRLAF